MSDWPRVAVVGAGAVGCFFGGMLARAGAPVTLFGRPGPLSPHLRAIESAGLRIDGVEIQETIPIEVARRVEAVRGADLVLFAVKTVYTEEAAHQLAPYVGPDTPVISLQNGVDNAERMRQAGIEAISAVVFVAAAIEEPGVVTHRGRGDLVIGDHTAGIAEWFARAGVPCRVSKAIDEELWVKLIINSMTNGISALTGATYGGVFEHAPSWGIALAVMDEAIAVAANLGVMLDRDAVLEKAEATIRSVGGATSSTQQDIANGRPTEIDSLNGYIARRGAEFGSPTPANSALHALVQLREYRR